MNGSLIPNVINEYEKQPPESRGDYYTWFLENEHLFDPAKPADEVRRDDLFRKLIPYLDPEDRAKDSKELYTLNPYTRTECVLLYACVSHGYTLPPQHPLWMKFGFCICDDIDGEGQLVDLYRRLIFGDEHFEVHQPCPQPTPAQPTPQPNTCTFSEFHTAYQADNLGQLFRSKGVVTAHSEILIPKLEWFFANGNPAWLLKAVLAVPEEEKLKSPPLIQIASANGLTDSLTSDDRRELKAVYRNLLKVVDPLKVHWAWQEKRLWELANSKVGVEPRFRTWMDWKP